MMLDLAETLNPLLDQRGRRLEDGDEDDEDVADTTLQLVFFDGEEAFRDWTDTDSVYGARSAIRYIVFANSTNGVLTLRHLASKWSTTYIAPNSKRRLLGHASLTELSTIEHIVLLDLLGAPNPTIRSYFIDTAWLFDAMLSAETRIRDAGALDAAETSPNFRSFFLPRTGSGNQHNYGYIGDDHVPFLQKGVNILHIIAYPFPRVWHTLRVRCHSHRPVFTSDKRFFRMMPQLSTY
jgi:glutaminyl-peptide cyclotransferase